MTKPTCLLDLINISNLYSRVNIFLNVVLNHNSTKKHSLEQRGKHSFFKIVFKSCIFLFTLKFNMYIFQYMGKTKSPMFFEKLNMFRTKPKINGDSV